MTSISKNVVSKLAVAAVATSMVFAAFAPAAKAQSSEDLQKMINDLLAQVASLQSQVGQGATSVASGVCPYTWTRDLSSGAKGADVMKLQQFLNADADTRVAAEGAGSVGAETEFYGPATAAAVSKLQVKYRADILSPAALVNPTGYFGPSSRAKANALCVTAPVVEDTTGTSTDDGDDTDDTDSEDVTLQGEASLDSYKADDASDDSVEEGAEDAEAAVFTAEFSDGDASISRIDVAFTSDDSGAKAWDAFDTVSLWVDGDKVAEAEASSKGDYLGDEDNGVIRFSGLDLVAMEDEELEITIAVSVQGNLDTEELSTWTVTTESLRFFDADGVATTDTTLVDDETAAFEIVEAGEDDEILVKTSSNDPNATTLKVETSKKSDDFTVFVFDIDTDDSTNDIELTEVVVQVLTTVAGYDALVSDAELVIDGTTIDDVDVVLSTTTLAGDTATLTFNVDSDVVIAAGERVEAELVLTFKALGGNEGATVIASIKADGDITGEGADDETSTGTATGDEHTLRTEGAVIEFVSSTETLKLNSDATTTDDSGTFVLKFDVTAFDTDLFINKTAASGTAMGTVGVNYQVTNGSGAVVSVGTPTESLSSDAKTVGTQYKVSEGETKTFTLTVSLDPSTTGFYGARVYGVNYKTVAGNPVTQQVARPVEDFESDALEI